MDLIYEIAKELHCPNEFIKITQLDGCHVNFVIVKDKVRVGPRYFCRMTKFGKLKKNSIRQDKW